MPQITEVRYKDDRDRYWVYIDGRFCTSIRARTFPAMGLEVGTQITCQELKDMESFHWKRQYGPASWKREQVRLDRAKQVIEMVDDKLTAKLTGFGAGSSEIIEQHPEESGSPDIDVLVGEELLLKVEVTGTEHRRGRNYWVRPDKLEYAQRHPDQDVWIMLIYHQPREHIVVIKTDNSKQYEPETIKIRESLERYVVFEDKSPEVHTLADFQNHLFERLS